MRLFLFSFSINNIGAGMPLLSVSFLLFLLFIVVQGSLIGPHDSIIVKIINTVFKKSAKLVTTLELLACLCEFLVKEMQAQD